MVSFFKYRQCIIIAPTVQRNFLCIFVFMVLLKQLRRLYTGGFIFQVPPVYNLSHKLDPRGEIAPRRGAKG